MRHGLSKWLWIPLLSLSAAFSVKADTLILTSLDWLKRRTKNARKYDKCGKTVCQPKVFSVDPPDRNRYNRF
ncbi:hypothetical protein WI664_04365, partial [Vibrio cholerae]